MEKFREDGVQGYTIIFKGRLDESWRSWFQDLEIAHDLDESGEAVTILSGKVDDQAALRGIINKLWDLNLRLISIHTASGAGRKAAPS
jgi:hypothetical protein